MFTEAYLCWVRELDTQIFTTMIDKRFFSFFIEGESRQNPYQIKIWKNDLVDESNFTYYNTFELRDNIFIEAYKYEDRFLGKLFNIDPVEIELFLNYHLKSYSGENEVFFKKIDLLFSGYNTANLHSKYERDDEPVEYPNISNHLSSVWDWQRTHRKVVPTVQNKLKWNGTPSQFGHIFYELANNGFIDPPMRRGQMFGLSAN